MLTTLHSYSSGGMISKEEENNLFSLISKSLHLPYTRGSKQRIMTNQIGSKDATTIYEGADIMIG